MCVLFWETKNSDVCQDRGNTSATVSVPSRLLRFLAAWCCCCCFLSSSKLTSSLRGLLPVPLLLLRFVSRFHSHIPGICTAPVMASRVRIAIIVIPSSFKQVQCKSSALFPKGLQLSRGHFSGGSTEQASAEIFFYHLHQKALCSSRFLCEMRSSPGCFSGLDPAICEGVVPFKALLNFLGKIYLLYRNGAVKSDCVRGCVRAQTWSVPGRKVLRICYSWECSDGPQVTYISHVLFRCMESHENLFSVRILFSIIHEQLTEFTCDLLHAVYKYSPYVCLSI